MRLVPPLSLPYTFVVMSTHTGAGDRDSYDVIVIGGGHAACEAALAAARPIR